MENSIYYTFSTMAQVLAGMIALLGAFLLYKMSQIDNELIGIAEAALMELRRNHDLQFIINIEDELLKSRIEKTMAKTDLNELKKRLDELVDIIDKHFKENNDFKEKIGKPFLSKYEFKNKIIKQTKETIIITAICIIFSIGILIIPTISELYYGTLFIFTIIRLHYMMLISIGLALFIVSLCKNVCIILEAITEKQNLTNK